MSDQHGPREMALPRTALVTLRRSLRSEVGPLGAVHALHAAGFETGRALSTDLLSVLGGELGKVDVPDFWERFREFWVTRGWGRLDHHDPHPAVGLLTSVDWAESDEEGREAQPSCSFTAGLLAGVLGAIAGGPVAVLEVRCRSRGDSECAFAFGGEAAVHDLYGALLEGADFAGAVATL